jgi:hypothetical protein
VEGGGVIVVDVRLRMVKKDEGEWLDRTPEVGRKSSSTDPCD